MDYKKLSIALGVLFIAAAGAAAYTSVSPTTLPPVTVTRTATVAATATATVTQTISADPLAAKVEAAKKEGELVFYYVSSNFEKVYEAFGKQYGIKASYVKGTAKEMTGKAVAEFTGGKYVPDIYDITSVNYNILALGGIQQYYSPALAGLPGGILEDYSQVPSIGSGTLYNIFGDVRSIGFHLNYVSQEEGQKLDYWKVVESPQFKGKKIMFTDPSLGGVGTRMFVRWIDIIGKDRAEEWVKKLVRQDPFYTSAENESEELFARGEAAVWLDGTLSKIENRKAQGAKIDWVRQLPKTITTTNVGISKFVHHQKAAELYIDWILSPRGMQEVVNIGRPALLLEGTNAPAIWREWTKPPLVGAGPQFVEADLNRDPYVKLWEKWRDAALSGK